MDLSHANVLYLVWSCVTVITCLMCGVHGMDYIDHAMLGIRILCPVRHFAKEAFAAYIFPRGKQLQRDGTQKVQKREGRPDYHRKGSCAVPGNCLCRIRLQCPVLSFVLAWDDVGDRFTVMHTLIPTVACFAQIPHMLGPAPQPSFGRAGLMIIKKA